MSERDAYPAGVPCWVDTLAPDPQRTAEFYARIFGWEFADPGSMPGGGRYLVARLRGRDVAAVGSLPADAGDAAAGAWNTYVRVESVEATVRAARDAGAEVLAGPFDAPPAGRSAVLADPAGARFCLWEAGSREGAELVNEPGAWSMSALTAPDPEPAIEFYGRVFGWEPDGSFPGMTLLRLPGYVGGTPTQPVPRDVVAVAVASEGGDAALWAVDFWTDDADAAADAAAAGGGRVLEPPHENGPFREAVLADPNGAPFTVSQLVAAPG